MFVLIESLVNRQIIAFKWYTFEFFSFSGSRQGTKHEVLVLTDGQSNCGKRLSTVLPRLHAKATVFGLMIGRFSSRGKKELTSYVSEPKPDHLFAVDNYQDLKLLLTLIKAKIGTSSPCAPLDLWDVWNNKIQKTNVFL